MALYSIAFCIVSLLMAAMFTTAFALPLQWMLIWLLMTVNNLALAQFVNILEGKSRDLTGIRTQMLISGAVLGGFGFFWLSEVEALGHGRADVGMNPIRLIAVCLFKPENIGIFYTAALSFIFLLLAVAWLFVILRKGRSIFGAEALPAYKDDEPSRLSFFVFSVFVVLFCFLAAPPVPDVIAPDQEGGRFELWIALASAGLLALLLTYFSIFVRNTMRWRLSEKYDPPKALRFLLGIYIGLLALNVLMIWFCGGAFARAQDEIAASDLYYNSAGLSAGFGCYVVIFALVSVFLMWLLPQNWSQNHTAQAWQKLHSIKKRHIAGVAVLAGLICLTVIALIAIDASERRTSANAPDYYSER